MPQQYLPEFHTAIINISSVLIAVASIITTLLAKETHSSVTDRPIKKERFLWYIIACLVGSLIFGILAMWYAAGWFLVNNVTRSFQAIYFLLIQLLLVFVPLILYLRALLVKK